MYALQWKLIVKDAPQQLMPIGRMNQFSLSCMRGSSTFVVMLAHSANLIWSLSRPS